MSSNVFKSLERKSQEDFKQKYEKVMEAKLKEIQDAVEQMQATLTIQLEAGIGVFNVVDGLYVALACLDSEMDVEVEHPWFSIAFPSQDSHR